MFGIIKALLFFDLFKFDAIFESIEQTKFFSEGIDVWLIFDFDGGFKNFAMIYDILVIGEVVGLGWKSQLVLEMDLGFYASCRLLHREIVILFHFLYLYKNYKTKCTAIQLENTQPSPFSS